VLYKCREEICIIITYLTLPRERRQANMLSTKFEDYKYKIVIICTIACTLSVIDVLKNSYEIK
jgi:hypothetical protein